MKLQIYSSAILILVLKPFSSTNTYDHKLYVNTHYAHELKTERKKSKTNPPKQKQNHLKTQAHINNLYYCSSDLYFDWQTTGIGNE